jgi:hypothetical protein
MEIGIDKIKEVLNSYNSKWESEIKKVQKEVSEFEKRVEKCGLNASKKTKVLLPLKVISNTFVESKSEMDSMFNKSFEYILETIKEKTEILKDFISKYESIFEYSEKILKDESEN